MKKLPVVLGVCLALAGCQTFDPDIDREADRRALEREAYHQEFGCNFSGDHDSYRQCVLNTYRNSKPKTFRVGQDEKGRSVAILRDETTRSFDRATDTYKTERVIVIETEERLVPVAMPTQPIAVPPAPVAVRPAPVAVKPAPRALPERTDEYDPFEMWEEPEDEEEEELPEIGRASCRERV